MGRPDTPELAAQVARWRAQASTGHFAQAVAAYRRAAAADDPNRTANVRTNRQRTTTRPGGSHAGPVHHHR